MVVKARDPDQAAAPADPVGAGLEALAAETASTLTPPPIGEGVTDLDVAAGAPAIPKMSNAQCLMMGAQLLRGTLTTVAKLQSPAVTMADDKLQPAADALGLVFDKHGWDLQALTGDYQLELAAVIITAPLAWAVHTGIQAEIKARPQTEVTPKIDKPTGPPGLAADPNGPAVFGKDDPRSISLNAS